MADQINPGAFRVMCDMWGVDDAIKNAKRMGLTVPDDMGTAGSGTESTGKVGQGRKGCDVA